MFENVEDNDILMSLDQGQGTTLTSGTCMYTFSVQCMPTSTS